MMGVGFGFTNQNTPIVNIDGRNTNEIEVIDEQHPLYGRKFKVSTDQTYIYNFNNIKSIRVKYKENIQILIPVSSTNMDNFPKPTVTKLTFCAVKDIVLLSQEVKLCPLKKKIFGQPSQMEYKMKF